MSKQVVLVGHCGPDSSYLRMAVQSVSKEVVVASADDDKELALMIKGGAALLLVNRTLDYGFSVETGVELIARLRAKFPGVKAMLVSNFPEAQAAAIAAGALPGFGKRQIGTVELKQILAAALKDGSSVVEPVR